MVQQPCQVFVALAEEGWTDSPATHAAARHYLEPPVREPRRRTRWCWAAPISPCSPSAIRETIGADVALVDSAETTAAGGGGSAWPRRGQAARAGDGTVRFFATDAPERFARVGAIFLGRAIDPGSVELVDLCACSYPFGGGSLSGRADESSVGSAWSRSGGALVSAATLTSRNRLISQGRPSSRNTARP